MPDTAELTASPVQRSIERGFRWIGALDHPHYEDERNRFVWYEASAIGAQLAIVGGYIAAGIMLLVYGADAIGPMWVMMTPILIASILMAAYAGRHAAEYLPSAQDLRHSRGFVHFAAGGFWAACYLFTEATRDDGAAITGIGIATALVFGLVVSVAGSRMARRRQQAREAALADD